MPNTDAKLEIMELFSGYLLCCDERNFNSELFASIFTSDAVVKMPFMRESKSVKDTQKLHASFFSQFKTTHHVSTDYVFFFSSDIEAEVRCKVSSFYDLLGSHMKAGQGSNFLTATAMFSVVHSGNCWHIRRLKVDIKNLYSLSVADKTKDIF